MDFLLPLRSFYCPSLFCRKAMLIARISFDRSRSTLLTLTHLLLLLHPSLRRLQLPMLPRRRRKRRRRRSLTTIWYVLIPRQGQVTNNADRSETRLSSIGLWSLRLSAAPVSLVSLLSRYVMFQRGNVSCASSSPYSLWQPSPLIQNVWGVRKSLLSFPVVTKSPYFPVDPRICAIHKQG